MRPILWTSESAQHATSAVVHGAEWEATGVAIDTRAVQQGDMFIALRGERTDGHAYLAQAHAAGAVVALVDHVPENTPAGLALLVVPDVMAGLEDLAREARARTQAKIIAVTGSVGKTSAKEALALALSAYGRVHATAGNFNNHIGLPLTLARMPAETEFAVLEMGMNHAGEIAPLSRLARPHVAAITTIDAVHIENFADGMEGIAKAKAEIFSGLLAGGAAILPADADDASVATLARAAHAVPDVRVLSFSRNSLRTSAADFQLRAAHVGVHGSRFDMQAPAAQYTVSMKAVGAHWAGTALLVLACVAALGLDATPAIAALINFQEPVGRGRMQPMQVAGAGVMVLDDSYNASPVSMRAAIEKLGMLATSEVPPRRAIAVLGQMLELGENAPQWHAELAETIIQSGVAQVFACGALTQHLMDALPEALRGGYAPDAQSLQPIVESALRNGDIVLIKGSHGSHVYRIAEAWSNHANGHAAA